MLDYTCFINNYLYFYFIKAIIVSKITLFKYTLLKIFKQKRRNFSVISSWQDFKRRTRLDIGMITEIASVASNLVGSTSSNTKTDESSSSVLVSKIRICYTFFWFLTISITELTTLISK